MPLPKSRSARLTGALLLALSLPLIAQTMPDAAPAAEAPPADAPTLAKDDPAILDAEMLPRASHALMLDIVQTASGLFAVGERGQVLTSERRQGLEAIAGTDAIDADGDRRRRRPAVGRWP